MDRTAAHSGERFDRPELDLLRLFAFLMVLNAHTMPGRWNLIFPLGSIGAMGLDLFFVLSAYLITELLLIEKRRVGTIDIKRFYVRRVLRLWPLLFVFLFAFWLRGLVKPTAHIPAPWILSLLLFCGNWYVARRHVFAPFPLGPLWSLSIEEQFYLLWPSTVSRLGRRTCIVVCASLFPVAWITLFLLARLKADPLTSIWTNSFVQFQMFAAGALLAFYLRGRRPALTGLQRSLAFLTGLACYVVAETPVAIHSTGDPWRLIAGYLLAAAGSCLLLVAVLGMRTRRWMQPLRYLGKISYGLYVFHIACISLAVRIVGPPDTVAHYFAYVTVTFALTALTATASFELLEKPFIRIKRRFEVIRTRPV